MKSDPTGLDRLHDLVLPPATPWWPPAPGWLWLLAAALVVLAVLGARMLSRWQRNRYRREALAEWQEIKKRTESNEVEAALQQLSGLLKRTAVTAYPRDQVASLSGPDWFAFLDRQAGTNFTAGTGKLLEQMVYNGRLDEVQPDQVRELLRESRDWIIRHTAWPASSTGDPSTMQPGTKPARQPGTQPSAQPGDSSA